MAERTAARQDQPSFSSLAKEETARHFSSRGNAQVAALAGILACIGKFGRSGNGQYELSVILDNRPAVTKCFTLISKTANINFDIAVTGNGDFSPGSVLGERRTLPLTSEEARSLASLCEALEPDGTVRPQNGTVSWTLLPDDESSRSCVRSMFLCMGSISDPGRQYHLEFAMRTREGAQQLIQLLKGYGIRVKMTQRRGRFVAYSSEAETIADILKLMDLRESLMHFEDARVQREVRGSVNRQVNCETSNIRKTVTAAQKQLHQIRLLEESGELTQLSPALQEMARVRLEHPDLSLQELGNRLSPPVGKSGVNHRLRKLSEAASRLEEADQNRQA